jgi:hypothetical protein
MVIMVLYLHHVEFIIDLRGVEVKRLIPLVALVVLVMILASLPVPVVSDISTSLTDSNITDSEITTIQTEASNSSASATITITMYAVDDE